MKSARKFQYLASDADDWRINTRYRNNNNNSAKVVAAAILFHVTSELKLLRRLFYYCFIVTHSVAVMSYNVAPSAASQLIDMLLLVVETSIKLVPFPGAKTK